MNCQQFTFLIIEAARGRMMDAAARDGATRHAETCAACAARLAREQNLTGALRTVAADMKDLSAPARVEAKLLAAFRESRADSQTATDASPVTTMLPAPAELPARDEVGRRASARRQTWRTASSSSAAAVATGIAASLALVALVALYQQFTRTALSPTPPPPQGITTNVSPQGGTQPSAAPAAIATLSPAPTPADSARRTKHDGPRPTRRAGSQRAPAAPPTSRDAPRMIASRQVIDGGSAIFAAGEGESAAVAANHAGGASRPNEAESVTEFISLVAGEPDAAPLESGQLVRVKMPRAALASLGLPLNAERGNEPVKADVLLGNDGLARAIRFVR